MHVILPSYNEDVGIISDLVTRIKDLGHEPLVVSNVPLPEDIPHIVRPGKIGYGNAIKEGLRTVKGDAAFMDADGTYVPEDLVKAEEKLKGGCDLVIVRRLVGKFGRPEGMTAGSYIRNILAEILFFVLHRKLLDTQSGFKVMSDRLRRKILEESKEGGMPFSTEVILIALRNGMRICEVQGRYLKREAGESKLSFRDVLSVLRLFLSSVF